MMKLAGRVHWVRPACEKEANMDGNYLSRPLIEGVSYEISDTDIAIQSPHTCYVRCKLPRRRDKDALLRQYSGVLAVAKAQRVKISYTLHIRKTIQELWPEYEDACAEREKLFAQLKKLAQDVKTRGIHLGTVDDEVLSAAQEVSEKLAAYGGCGTPSSRIAEIGFDLSRLEQWLSREHGPDRMISL